MITSKISKSIKYIQEKQKDLNVTRVKSHGDKPKTNAQKLKQHDIVSSKSTKLLILKNQ